MVSGRKLRLVLPRSVRAFPADLGAVLALVVMTWIVVFAPVVRETALRVVLGAAFVLFAPGYAITAALFPESDEANPDAADGRSESSVVPRFGKGLGVTERFTTAVVVSVLVVPLFGLALNFSPFDIGLTTVVVSMSVFTVGAVILAAVRRWNLPREDRFRLPTDRWQAAVRSEFLTSETKLDRALNVVILASLLVATVSVAYAVAGPESEQRSTEFYLLTENETGELVADEYPTTFRDGESKSLVVGVANHESRPTDYVVLVRLQRVEVQNGSARVVASQRLERFQIRADAGETMYRNHTVTPTMTGGELRLQYLLFVGEVPANPSSSNAYRQAHVWVNVTAQ